MIWCPGLRDCTVCAFPEEQAPIDPPPAVPEDDNTDVVARMEAAAIVLGVGGAASYFERRSALMRAALAQSSRLSGLVPISSTMSRNVKFSDVFRAFNILANRKGPTDEWQADDIFPQLQCAEFESIPMPRLLSVSCVDVWLDPAGTRRFIVAVQCSTRHDHVQRDAKEFAELHDKLSSLGLNLPPVPTSPSESLVGRLSRAMSPRSIGSFDSSGDEIEVQDISAHVWRPHSSSKADDAARAAAQTYLTAALRQLRDRNKYSAALHDFLGLDVRERCKIHRDDLKLALCELARYEATASDDLLSSHEFAVATDWNEAWLAFLRSETHYYGPPGPPNNTNLAVDLAVGGDSEELSRRVVLHSPAKWSLVTLAYGDAERTLQRPRLKRRRRSSARCTPDAPTTILPPPLSRGPISYFFDSL